jgi:hypothetical protein
MIVRAVLDNPSLIERFDWFNDGKDTIWWLRWIMKSDEAKALADQMEIKLQLYHETRDKKFSEK